MDLEIGRAPSGRPLRWRKSSMDRSFVASALAQAVADHGRGRLAAGDQVTMESYLGWWLANVARPRVEERIWIGYEQQVRLRLVPALGGVRLQKLAAVHVDAFYANLARAGVSRRLIQHTQAVLHAALQDALKRDLVGRNVAGLVELPAPPHRARPILTVEQARALIAGVEGAPLGGLHVLALTTGLREGELFGLAWEDVDWQAGVVLLRHNLTWLRGRGPALKVPKSGRGRAVVLTPQGLVALRRRQVAQAAERLAGGRAWSNPWNLIFTN
ncbi:MAG: site-specific integrase [Chloroflexota bacterium]